MQGNPERPKHVTAMGGEHVPDEQDFQSPLAGPRINTLLVHSVTQRKGAPDCKTTLAATEVTRKRATKI